MALLVKNSPAKRFQSDPRVRKIPWRRARQPTPGLWPGESQGQRRRKDHSPRGRRELATTEAVWRTESKQDLVSLEQRYWSKMRIFAAVFNSPKKAQ